MKNIRLFFRAMILAVCAAFASCNSNTPAEPKPMGYFRIELPDHSYTPIDSAQPAQHEAAEKPGVKILLPFKCEISEHATSEIIPQPHNSLWLNVDYPYLNASFRFTCLEIDNADSLRKLMISEDRMVKFHYQKAEDVQYSIIRDTAAGLWGQIYEIYGKDVATPFQFWVTDSARHFVRATLYFDGTPNNDSLQPVIDYLKEDGMHLINSFEWR